LNKKDRIEVGILALLHGTSHMYQSALSPLYLLIQNEFNLSFSSLGLIGSFFSITSMLQGFAGHLVDKLGWKKLTLTGILIYSITLFGFSLSPSFLVLLIFVFIAGISSTTFHPATYSLISRKSRKENLTKNLAYHQFGGFLGGAISIALVAYLASYIGWRATLRTLPLIGLAPILLFWFLVKEEKVNNTTQIDIHKGDSKFIISWPLLIVFLATFFNSVGGGAFIFLPTFLTEVYGESLAFSGILTSITQGVGCLSLIIGGILADKIDRVSIVFTSYILTGIFTVLLSIGNFSSKSLLLILAFLGFAQYFGGPAMHALTLLFSIDSTRGRAIGLEFTFISLGGIFASLLVGYFSDLFGIKFAFVICSIFKFIAGVVILVLKRDKSSARDDVPLDVFSARNSNHSMSAFVFGLDNHREYPSVTILNPDDEIVTEKNAQRKGNLPRANALLNSLG